MKKWKKIVPHCHYWIPHPHHSFHFLDLHLAVPQKIHQNQLEYAKLQPSLFLNYIHRMSFYGSSIQCFDEKNQNISHNKLA